MTTDVKSCCGLSCWELRGAALDEDVCMYQGDGPGQKLRILAKRDTAGARDEAQFIFRR